MLERPERVLIADVQLCARRRDPLVGRPCAPVREGGFSCAAAEAHALIRRWILDGVPRGPSVLCDDRVRTALLERSDAAIVLLARGAFASPRLFERVAIRRYRRELGVHAVDAQRRGRCWLFLENGFQIHRRSPGMMPLVV